MDTVTPNNGDIRVYLMSSADTGFADFVALPAGSTIQQLWQRSMAAHDASKFVIRCQRQEGRLPADFQLQDGDRITITPHKVQGA